MHLTEQEVPTNLILCSNRIGKLIQNVFTLILKLRLDAIIAIRETELVVIVINWLAAKQRQQQLAKMRFKHFL